MRDFRPILRALSIKELQDLSDMLLILSNQVKSVRKELGDCVCIGLVHQDDCPEWTLPI